MPCMNPKLSFCPLPYYTDIWIHFIYILYMCICMCMNNISVPENRMKLMCTITSYSNRLKQ